MCKENVEPGSQPDPGIHPFSIEMNDRTGPAVIVVIAPYFYKTTYLIDKSVKRKSMGSQSQILATEMMWDVYLLGVWKESTSIACTLDINKHVESTIFTTAILYIESNYVSLFFKKMIKLMVDYFVAVECCPI